MMVLVTEAELAAKVHQFLESSDLNNTTNSIVIKKLESEFGVDLSHQKPFLRHQVDRFLQSQYPLPQEQEEDHHQLLRDYHVLSDSDDDDDDDEYYDHVQTNNNNGSTKLKGIRKLDRPASQNKEKIKKTCFPDQYCTLSPGLQQFLGVPHMNRTEIVKQLWTYVKEKSLQDPNDGKSIICDETLRDLLGVDSINILQINKALSKHIRPSEKLLKDDKSRKREKEEEVKPLKGDKPRKQAKEEEVEPLKANKPWKDEKVEEVKSLQKDKPRKQGREEDMCGDETQEKRQKKVLSGFLAPLPLSDTLIRFLGTGEIALTRPEVIKRVWEYIKDNKLQDPRNKKTIICDEKLKELFNLDSFHGFTVSKLLTPHFVKILPSPITFPTVPSNQLQATD